MNDKKLADKCVALGVGGHGLDAEIEIYWIGDSNTMLTKKFVRDWRVAGALMEKCQKMYVEYIGEPEQTVYARAENNRTWDWPAGENLPRLIIEACCVALGDADA